MQQSADINEACHATRLSCSRIKNVVSFYYPLLRWQMIIYPCISLMLFLLSALVSSSRYIDAFWTTPLTVIEIMFYLAPLVLTRRDYRLTETLLPATALEKTIVLAGYFLVVVPLLTVGVFYIVGWFIELIIPQVYVIHRIFDLSNSVQQQIDTVLQILNEFTNYVPAITCLLTVMLAKRNRALKGIVFSIVSMIVLGFIGVIYGILYIARSEVFRNIMNGSVSVDQDSVQNMVLEPMIQSMMPFIVIVSLLSLCYVVVGVWWLYRTIKNRQIL